MENPDVRDFFKLNLTIFIDIQPIVQSSIVKSGLFKEEIFNIKNNTICNIFNEK